MQSLSCNPRQWSELAEYFSCTGPSTAIKLLKTLNNKRHYAVFCYKQYDALTGCSIGGVNSASLAVIVNNGERKIAYIGNRQDCARSTQSEPIYWNHFYALKKCHPIVKRNHD
jgi:hypothetical protein